MFRSIEIGKFSSILIGGVNADRLLSCLQRFTESLTYAFFPLLLVCLQALIASLYVQVAAAKDTWNLLRKRGIDALVNDSLVGIVLTTGAYIVGLLTALFAYLYVRVVFLFVKDSARAELMWSDSS